MGGAPQVLALTGEADAPIRARVLGTFELTVGGRRIERGDWGRMAAARLVKLLLVSPGHRLSRELAAETLWPEADPAGSRANLRKALMYARRALGMPNAITSAGDVIGLDASSVDLDLDRLTAAYDVLEGRTASPVAATLGDQGAHRVADAAAIVLELGSGTLLPDDAYEEWLAATRERLWSRWHVVAMDAAAEAAASGRGADAHRILERVLDFDPADEEAHRLLIELYAAQGRHHAARRQFERCRLALADGLDVGPSAETEAAYRRAEQAARAPAMLSGRSCIVGRRRELELIEPPLERVAAGRSAAIIIRGPAGIGKTRLLDEVRGSARRSGFRELFWHAVESTRSIAFAPFTLRLAAEVTLAELERWDEPARSGLVALLPHLDAVPHFTFADPSALKIALVAGLSRLASRVPHLFAIDDLPELDEASTELLGAIATALDTSPVLVVVTYRDEEPLPAPARQLLDTLRRSGSTELRLGPLSDRDIEPLVVAHLGGAAVGPSLAGELFTRSDGNPLFCLELVREARDRGAIVLDKGCWRLGAGATLGGAPETVRQVVASRSRALPIAAVELLRVAAELGPDIRYDTLAAVMPDLPGGLIAALDAALESGVLVERGAGYAFAHPLYQAAVEAGAGLARRADTHLAIACALAGLDRAAARAPDQVRAAAAGSLDPSPVAEHALRAFALGRAEAASLAIGFGFVAASRARALFDRAAAASLLDRSLDAWKRMPSGAARQFDASDAYAGLAEIRMAAGDDPGAEASFRSAIAAARDPEELATAYERFSWLAQRHGDYDVMLAVCAEGLARLPADAPVPRAILSQRIGYCLTRLHRLDAAIAELEAAIPVLEAAGKLWYAATSLDMLGTSCVFAGRTEDGFAALRRAIAIALEHPEFPMHYVHAHLGALLTRVGRPADGRPQFARALEMSEQRGEWYEEAVSAWLAAETEDALGNLEGARQLRSRELGLLARVGGNPHHEALAHAHLAHLARLLLEPETERCEAARARELAASDPDPEYRGRIEAALSVADWSEVQAY